MSNLTYAPNNIREMLQRSSTAAASQAVESAIDMTVGGLDGRFLTGFPGETIQLENEDGQFYFIVGFSRANGLHVAAPL